MKLSHMSIRKKMLLFTILIMGLIFLFQFFLNVFFVEKFYFDRQTGHIKTKLDNLETYIKKMGYHKNKVKVANEIQKLQFNLEQPIIIFTENGFIDNSIYHLVNNSYMVVEENDSQKEYTVNLQDFSNEDKIRWEIQKYKTFTIEGYLEEDNIFPIKINMPSGEVYEDKLFYEDGIEILKLDVKFLSYKKEDFFEEINYESENLLLEQVETHLELIMNENKINEDKDKKYYELRIKDPESLKYSYIIIKKIDVAENTEASDIRYIATIVTFLSIKPSILALQEYNGIAFSGALFISLILATYFTGIFVKPVKEMTKITKNMAKMDFSQRLSIHSKDEFGQLSANFNELSQKLQKNIGTLESTNQKLSLEIEKGKKQQEIFKAFLNNASHELKTPITIMKGYMDGLMDGVYKPEIESFQSAVGEEVERMEAIVFNLIHVSQMEQGAMQLHYSFLNPSDLIYDVYQRHKRAALRKKINFHFNFQDSFIKADIGLMETVFDNLIGNCVRYTPEEENVYCQINIEGESDDIVSISIENTGVYIEELDFENIFKPFYKADKSHSRKNEGSGLGLSIVKNVLDLHKFNFTMKNTDLGVCFSLWVSRVKEK